MDVCIRDHYSQVDTLTIGKKPAYHSTRRRSIPRLPDFSITPLTAHIEQSFTDEYGVHSYSQPQTPRSPRSAFHSPSHTPTVLSRASSRDPARRRKVKSVVLLADLDTPTPDSAAYNQDDMISSKKSKSSLRLHKIQTDVAGYSMKGHLHKSKSIAGIATTSRRSSSSNHGQGSDWLLSTASILAMNTAESKGQSWLATKSSSTSLVGTPYLERDDSMCRPFTRIQDDDDFLNSPQASQPGTRRNSILASAGIKSKSRGGSRTNSRIMSRVGSRVNLSAGLGRSMPGEMDRRADYFANMRVDYADQAMVDGEEDDDSGSELDEFEEDELKKLVWGRVGGWVDWAVGWMDWRDGLEGVDEEESDEMASGQEKSEMQEGLKQRRKKKAAINLDGAQADAVSDASVIPSPPETAGIVGDAKWLIGIASKLIV